jgi:RecJ-like exonuclease
MLRLISCGACASTGKVCAGVRTTLCGRCDGRGFSYVFEPDQKLAITVRNGTSDTSASGKVA